MQQNEYVTCYECRANFYIETEDEIIYCPNCGDILTAESFEIDLTEENDD